MEGNGGSDFFALLWFIENADLTPLLSLSSLDSARTVKHGFT
jgi:hypothetical protein